MEKNCAYTRSEIRGYRIHSRSHIHIRPSQRDATHTHNTAHTELCRFFFLFAVVVVVVRFILAPPSPYVYNTKTTVHITTIIGRIEVRIATNYAANCRYIYIYEYHRYYFGSDAFRHKISKKWIKIQFFLPQKFLSFWRVGVLLSMCVCMRVRVCESPSAFDCNADGQSTIWHVGEIFCHHGNGMGAVPRIALISGNF